MKAVLRRVFLLVFIIAVTGCLRLMANGCTGSWFTVNYTPWCDCYQVCGNYISDCDQLVSVSWDFGDGTPTITGGSPCHHYANPGNYTVTMTVVAYCHTVFNLWTTTCYITQQLSVTSNPTLQANFVTDTVCNGIGTQFTSTSITPAGDNTYQWDFGDGTTGTGATPNHTFDSCGVFNVKLIVTNTMPCCNGSGSDTIIKKVYVNCNPFDHSNTAGSTDPFIHESSSHVQVTSGSCPGDTTHFQLVNLGPITHWQWLFPDSTTSTSATPSYVYTACPPAINFTKVYLTTDHGCKGIVDSVTGIFCPSNVWLSTTKPLCTGQCSGTATVIMSGGTPPYGFVWSDPAHQSSVTATNLCPGSYYVTVTDGNGCHASPPSPAIVVDFPFPFSGVATVQGNVRCYGDHGGSAVLDVSGGTAPYTYFWSNGATTDTVTGLLGGVNYVTATDAHGCTTVNQVNIPQPPPIGATIAPVNANCSQCNGTATVNATGGNGTYTYTWLTAPVQSTQTATALCSGVYQVIVEDAVVTGCRDTFSTSISENGAQAVTTTSTNAQCANICNGTATANLTGGCGIAPCTFDWLDSTGAPVGQTNATATNLCAGKYTVRVTNGSGCRSFADVIISIPNPVVPAATATLNTCGATCNATITASATGGTTPYSYQWMDSTHTVIAGQTNASITNRCTGNYYVRVTDGQGCIADAPATVLSNPFTASATATPVKCYGDCNGIITAAAGGGLTPYQYTLKDANSNTVYSGASAIMANLCAGDYTLVVTDAGSCAITIPVSINQPPVLDPAPAMVAPLCYGLCNGSVTSNATGGTPPYTYEWHFANGGALPGGNAATVNNLCAGSYIIRITDANNCISPYTPIQLLQPAKLTDSLAAINPYCSAGLGSIAAYGAGGTTPYTYIWSTGSTAQIISNLPSGTYIATITDAHNCRSVDSTTFVQLPLLSATLIPTLHNGYQFQCAGHADGEVVVRVTGGLPPYTYQWNDSARSRVDSIYGLSPGMYTVTITDAHQCIYIDSVNFNKVPPPFSVNIDPHNVKCYGSKDGSIYITPVGGVPPYLYYWNFDTSSATRNLPLTNIDTGLYILTLFDSVRCVILDTIHISEPAPLNVSHSSTAAICNNSNTGTATETANGGTPPYTFSWNAGADTGQTITGKGAGQYIVIVTDSNGCKKTDTATITQPPPMATQVTHTNVSCYAGADGHAGVTANGGTTPYSYNWNNGQYNTQNIQALPAGHYVVVVTDSNHCTATDSTDITQPGPITGSRQVSICASDSFYTGGSYQTVAGIYIDTLHALNGCDSILSTDLSVVSQFTGQFQQTVCYGQGYNFNGTYYSSGGIYSDTLVSSGGCDSIVTFTLNVLPDIGLYASPDEATILAGDSITVNIYSNSNDIVSYSWSPNYGISCANCSTSIVMPGSNVRYTVIAVDTNGCRDTVSIPIIVEGGVIFVPNVFTPNGDGVNDVFKVYGRGFRKFKLMVFDRWGEKLFETTNPNEGWNGTYKGQPMPPAVYVYLIDVDFLSGITPPEYYQFKKGSITLLR